MFGRLMQLMPLFPSPLLPCLPALRFVEELVQAEIDGGLPSEKVVVAGLSQGGGIAVQILRSDKKLTGTVGKQKGGSDENGSARIRAVELGHLEFDADWQGFATWESWHFAA
jgi:hypothetical protein